MKIQVKKEHINQGIAATCNSCPVALAVNEQLQNAYAEVGIYTLKLTSVLGGEDFIKLPKIVTDFIKRFDGNIRVEPFEFEIDIPAKYLRKVRFEE